VKTFGIVGLDEISFDAPEAAVLDEIDRRLRADGWATHVTVTRLLRDWQTLAISADRYIATIDDYTNDLAARDGLEIALGLCHGPLHAKLKASIDQADREFLARTRDDDDHVLGQFYRMDESAGWWWKRRPAAGPLAEYLAT
jgi:hypothetical protein